MANMKSSLLIVVLVIITGIPMARAGELGHYLAGGATIRDFIVPDPGFYYLQYNIFYSTDTYKDRNGNSVDSVTVGGVTLNIDTDVDMFAVAPTFIWVSDWKFLGATYAAIVAPTFGNTSVQAALRTETGFGKKVDESQFALGDLYVRPVWLGWNSEHFALAAVYGVYAPVGKYHNGNVDNVGLGFWSHEFQTSATWFPWEHQGTAVMLTGTYEINSEIDDVNITPGDRLTLDYGVSQLLPINEDETQLLELGIAGYSQWQTEKDSGSDVRKRLNVKDQIYGIGGQIALASIPWDASLTFRYLTEYNAEARFEGDLLTLTIAKGF